MKNQNTPATPSVTLENAKAIGLSVRKSGQSLQGFLKALDDKTKTFDDVKRESYITAHIEAILLGASRLAADKTTIDKADLQGSEARRAIWASIRQAISKKDLLLVGETRPQAKQGSNWLVKWGVPQESTKAATSDYDKALKACQALSPAELVLLIAAITPEPKKVAAKKAAATKAKKAAVTKLLDKAAVIQPAAAAA